MCQSENVSGRRRFFDRLRTIAGLLDLAFFALINVLCHWSFLNPTNSVTGPCGQTEVRQLRNHSGLNKYCLLNYRSCPKQMFHILVVSLWAIEHVGGLSLGKRVAPQPWLDASSQSGGAQAGARFGGLNQSSEHDAGLFSQAIDSKKSLGFGCISKRAFKIGGSPELFNKREKNGINYTPQHEANFTSPGSRYRSFCDRDLRFR